MNETSEHLFLKHLLQLINDNIETITPVSKSINQFDAGKAFAYHEIAEFINECSGIFKIPLKNLGIEEMDADKLL